jgi:hypothetical protein
MSSEPLAPQNAAVESEKGLLIVMLIMVVTGVAAMLALLG